MTDRFDRPDRVCACGTACLRGLGREGSAPSRGSTSSAGWVTSSFARSSRSQGDPPRPYGGGGVRDRSPRDTDVVRGALDASSSLARVEFVESG